MRRANAIFDGVLRLCAAIAAVIIAAIALLISVNVVLRNTGAGTLYGLLDAVEYGLLAATFLGAPWVLWKRAHVTVDLVTAALPETWARPMARIVAAIGLIVSAVFLWYALQAALASAARGSMIRTAFTIPEWWVLSVAPIGFGLICLEFLRQLVAPPTGRHGAAGL
jgi:TRAP-type C4-dicarboxylate transport system permease small subunit